MFLLEASIKNCTLGFCPVHLFWDSTIDGWYLADVYELRDNLKAKGLMR